MDELFILTPARRVRNNCQVDARNSYGCVEVRPPHRSDAAPARGGGVRPGAAGASVSATGRRGAGGCGSAPSVGQRSHPGGEKLRMYAAESPYRHREKDFFEPIASPRADSRRPVENPRLCPRWPLGIGDVAPRLPRTSRRIVRGLTPAQGRVKQPSHSRSSGARVTASAADASAGFQTARRGLPVPTAYR
jgi:hypothetical protein